MGQEIPSGVASAVHELEQRERRFRSLFESALDAILIFDDSGRVLEANAAAASLLGRAGEPLPGKRFEQFCADAEDGRRIWTDFRTAGQLRREFTITRFEGSHRLVESIIIADVVLGQHVGVIRDVTDQRSHERERLRLAERFERLFRTDLIGMAMLNRQTGCIDDCNRKLAEFFGRRPEDFIGRHVGSFSDLFVNQHRYQRLLVAWGSGAPLKGLSVECVLPDGSRRHGLATLESLPEFEGCGAVDVALVVDITEQHRLEVELRNAQRLEAIGRLAGAIAHDFNNLLAVISGFATLLDAALDPDAEARDSVEEIKKAASRAVKLTHGLLAFSRQEVFHVRAVDLHDVLYRARGALQDLFGPLVRVEFRLEAMHPWVKTDALQLEHVLLQLASNSREAMPNGGTFTVATEDEASELKLSIHDSGVGMEPSTLERAFEPFFTTKPDHSGTGLGLATVYGVVTHSGGRVSVDSEPARGTTVTMLFPTAEASEVDDYPPLPTRTSPVAGTETLLLVENDTSLALLIESFLGRLGYRVLRATAADEAARAIGAYDKPIDLAIVDATVSAGDAAVIDRLRQHQRDLRVIVLALPGDVIPEPVADPYTILLARPFALSELAATARTVLDRAHVREVAR
jgi:PAS domain S-box-containing protein